MWKWMRRRREMDRLPSAGKRVPKRASCAVDARRWSRVTGRCSTVRLQWGFVAASQADRHGLLEECEGEQGALSVHFLANPS